ncbi:MAG: helix-turn-helix domain-containing protein [Pseudonocardiaceae bacterium]
MPLTFEELNALPTAVDLMTAARALGIGRTKAYQLAKAGQFPVRIIRVGNGYHVPTAELLKLLGVTPLPTQCSYKMTSMPEPVASSDARESTSFSEDGPGQIASDLLVRPACSTSSV